MQRKKKRAVDPEPGDGREPSDALTEESASQEELLDPDKVLDDVLVIAFGVAMSLIHDEDDAEDIAQDVAWVVWRGQTNNPSFLSLTPDRWKFTRTVTVNLVIDRARVAGSHEEKEGQVTYHIESNRSTEGDPDKKVEATELAMDLRRAISGLAPRAKEAVRLLHDELLGPTESAARMGCSPKAVSNRLTSAFYAMREVLEKHDPRNNREKET